MSEELLKNTLKSIGLPVAYFQYKGTKPQYIVYNEETEQPSNYGDNKPLESIAWWQVHIFSTKEIDFRNWKKETKKLLLKAGFTVTDIETLYEKETETIHVVICCHIEESEE